MSKTLLERVFEDGSTTEILEFLDAAENLVADRTAYIEVEWVGEIGKPRTARLIDDDPYFTVEITGGDWEEDDADQSDTSKATGP